MHTLKCDSSSNAIHINDVKYVLTIGGGFRRADDVSARGKTTLQSWHEMLLKNCCTLTNDSVMNGE